MRKDASDTAGPLGRRLSAIGAVAVCGLLLAGCVSEKRDPLSLATPHAGQALASAVPAGGQSAPTGVQTADAGAAAGTLPPLAEPIGPPDPQTIVADRGGSIMVETGDERAERRRLLAKMRRDIDDLRVKLGAKS